MTDEEIRANVMRFCDPHWAKLRAAIDERGLSEWISKDSDEVLDKLESELVNDEPVFDPLFNAYFAILSNLGEQFGMINVMIVPGCPLCHANGAQEMHCAECNEGCLPDYFETWIQRASDDELEKAKGLGLVS